MASCGPVDAKSLFVHLPQLSELVALRCQSLLRCLTLLEYLPHLWYLFFKRFATDYAFESRDRHSKSNR